jgi:hypothetical protein
MDEVPPPWLVLPDLPVSSIGWRMGDGEEALYRFIEYFHSLPLEQARALKDRYPEPEGWTGFLDNLLRSRTDV